MVIPPRKRLEQGSVDSYEGQKEVEIRQSYKQLRAAHKTDRAIKREGYLRSLPQNLSTEVEVSKAFGGKNALVFMQNKQKR